MIKTHKHGIAWSIIASASSICILFFLLFPVLYAFLWSVTEMGGSIGKWESFSFRWFIEVYSDAEWRKAIFISFVYASISSTISLLFVIIYSYYSFWKKGVYQIIGTTLFTIPLFFPILIYALALKMEFPGFPGAEYISLVLGHISIIIPIQYFIIESSRKNLKPDWFYSSKIMGASTYEIIWQVIIPNIKNPMLLAFACGFLYSFDETVISNFLIDGSNVTVPKKIWLDFTRDINPKGAVVYISVMLLTLAILLSISYFKKVKFMTPLKHRKKRFSHSTDIFHSFCIGAGAVLLEVIIVYLWSKEFHPILTVVSFVISVIFVEIGIIQVWGIYFSSREILDKIYVFRKSTDEKFRDVAVDFLSYKLEAEIATINSFFHTYDGKKISLSDSEKLSSILFEKSKGDYFGIDSNVPSEFKKIYANYLHSDHGNKTKVRIILSDQDMLEEDFNNHKKDFNEFFDWHIQKNIMLVFVPRTEAVNLQNSYHLVYTDIGIWSDNYIVIFKPEVGVNETTIQYWFKSYIQKDDSKNYVQFFISLLDKGKLIRVKNGHLSLENLDTSLKQNYQNKLKNLWGIL